MSKLLARAKVKRENAENCYAKIGMDDAYLDDCCYNLQQAVEMSLKYLIELNGGTYIENHDIRAQLNKLNKMKAAVPEEQRLRNMAATINSWESEARYLDSFTAVMSDVEEVREIADTLIAEIDKKVKQTTLKGLKTFPDK